MGLARATKARAGIINNLTETGVSLAILRFLITGESPLGRREPQDRI
jgi:hypothetical protein